MHVSVSKASDGTWAIRPVSGRFESAVVAKADAVNLYRVRFEGKTMVGLIKAVHGLSILCEKVYDDARTLRALGIRHTFDTALGEPLIIDYDGFLSKGLTGAKAARRVVAIGEEVYAKGVTWRE